MALNDSFWNNEQNRLLAILQPRLEQMAFDAAKQAAHKAGIAFNPNLSNANAAKWARDYTDTLLKQLGTTSSTGIGEIVARWVENRGATYGQLQQQLVQYGAVRAQAIAVTETTRAYAEGERMSYLNEGIIYWAWMTNRDDLTCSYCGPLNGKVVRIGDAFGTFRGENVTQPPYHPQCRCWCAPIVKPNMGRDSTLKLA
jgi:SPP1 gp7 family putative phage head morphogenesis protein